jgi:cytochrome c biogenesis DsbD-like protein
LPTSITYVKNPLIVVVGTTKEEGKLEKKHEDVFDLDVKYYNNQVSFVQTVKLVKNVKTNISGEIRFMVCTDRQCLPPTEVPFSINLN